jgi:hypothetical protein
MKLSLTAAILYVQAAEMSMKYDLTEAMEFYRSSISIFCDYDLYLEAASLECILADMSFKHKHWFDAYNSYRKAAGFFYNELYNTKGDVCSEKAAFCLIELGRLKEASHLYSLIAQGCCDNNLRRFNSCKYLLKSIICLFGIPCLSGNHQTEYDNAQNISENGENKLQVDEKYELITKTAERFHLISYLWKESKEYQFVCNLLKYRKVNNYEEFINHVYWWNVINPLDYHSIQLLKILNEEIENEVNLLKAKDNLIRQKRQAVLAKEQEIKKLEELGATTDMLENAKKDLDKHIQELNQAVNDNNNSNNDNNNNSVGRANIKNKSVTSMCSEDSSLI